MKVLVLGGLGSIGSRYVSILKHLGHEPFIWDIKEPQANIEFFEWDKAIIATPTDTHYGWCNHLINLGKPFLCEKPMSKSLRECEVLVRLDRHQIGSIVFNYSYFVKRDMDRVSYNYFKTGNDGLWWDVCQLLSLDPKAVIKTDSPIWEFYVNTSRIAYEDLEKSYIKMISQWIDGKYKMNLEQGLRMTHSVLERIKREDSIGDSSKN